jgi:alanine racemase
MQRQTIATTRPNRLESDMGAITSNFRSVRRHLKPGTKIFAALKGDAYGFGLQPVARALVDAGAYGIAVADQAEAIALREHGVRTPILLYAGHLAGRETVQATLQHGLIPTLVELAEAAEYSRLADRPIEIFVKIDVGLERLGVAPEEAADFVAEVKRLPRLQVAGVYTHLHVPAGVTEELLRWQVGRFDSALAAITRTGVPVPLRMLASSASLAQISGLDYDAVDPGGLLFGSGGAAAARIDFCAVPALRAITSRIVQVKAVSAPLDPELAPYPFRAGMRIAVLPLGTRDGLPRFNAGRVLIRGRPAPMAGPISIEHVRVDVTDIPEAATGDEAVIVGRQGEAEITAAEAMAHCGHKRLADLAMAVSPTIPRIAV